MISKIPVPITLLKQSLGIRESDDVIKVSVTGDVIYLYVITEGDSAAEFTNVSVDTPMEFSLSVEEDETN